MIPKTKAISKQIYLPSDTDYVHSSSMSLLALKWVVTEHPTSGCVELSDKNVQRYFFLSPSLIIPVYLFVHLFPYTALLP